jgi:hypothetical protein
VLDKPAIVKSARARTAARMPMPIISNVAMPLDDTEHAYARRSSSQDLSFQESQRWENRVAVFCFAKIEACCCRCSSMFTRHSAKLSRLLTAGTKSLFSLIAGESILKHADRSALEPNKQGNELQDWEVNQPPHSGTLEGQFLQQHRDTPHDISCGSSENKNAITGLRSSSNCASDSTAVGRAGALVCHISQPLCTNDVALC